MTWLHKCNLNDYFNASYILLLKLLFHLNLIIIEFFCIFQSEFFNTSFSSTHSIYISVTNTSIFVYLVTWYISDFINTSIALYNSSYAFIYLGWDSFYYFKIKITMLINANTIVVIIKINVMFLIVLLVIINTSTI